MYIRQRGSTYHFRFNVPKRYRQTFGWSINRSLGTDPIVSSAVAKTMGKSLKKIMSKSLDDATIKRLVDTYVEDTLESIDHCVNIMKAVSLQKAELELETLELLKTDKEEALFRRDYARIKRVVDELLDGRDVNKQSHNKLSRAVLRAAIDLDQVQIDAHNGEPVPVSLETETPVVSPHPAPVAVEPVDPGPLLSEFVEEFPKTKPKWSPAAHSAYQSATNVLLKILGDIPVGTITRATVVKYRETLSQSPAFWLNRHPNVKAEDLPVPGLPTIGKSTFERNLVYMGQLMDYAVDCGYLNDSPMPKTGMSLPESETETHQFNDEQVKIILKETKEFNDYRYWLPLLGLYTGCRANEVCQLHKEDLKQEGEIWYLDINADGKKTLKNKDSKRLIPLHPAIIELGFIEYVQGVDHHRIFPECKYRESTGKYANNFGQWFNRLLVKTDIKPQGDRTITFHSFRHRTYTTLKRLGINNEHIDRIIGHKLSETQNVTYHHGYELADLKADIDMIPDHRDLSLG